MEKLKNAIIWYTKGGLFHPLYIFLLLLPTLLLLPYRNDPMFDNYLMFYVDLTIMPVAALMAALHIVREPQISIFEINIFKSLRIIYTAKLLVFLIALFPGFFLLMLLLVSTEKISIFLIPLIQKILTYTAIIAVALLLDMMPRNVLVYLLVFFVILPYATPILLNRALILKAQLDPTTSIINYFIAPVTSSLYNDALGLPTQTLQLIAFFMSMAIITLSYLIYSKREFTI